MRLDRLNWRAVRMALLGAAALVGCALPGYSVGESGGTEASSSGGAGGAAGSSASAGGAGGAAGAGGGGTCTTNIDCPLPTVRCMSATCSNGECVDMPVTGDHVSLNKVNVPGDCRKYTCESGQAVLVPDANDPPMLPNKCVVGQCKEAVVVAVHAPVGTMCSTDDDPSGACAEGECHDCFGQVGCMNSAAQPTCVNLECVASHCEDGVVNGDETAKDCGGTCLPCALGKTCGKGSDCITKNCSSGTCQEPTCSDGQKNGTEAGIDCGDSQNLCGGCGTGAGCTTADGCESHVCKEGFCQPPACDDGVMNGEEEGVDCGGSSCKQCG